MPLMSLVDYARHCGIMPAAVTKLKNRGALDDALVQQKGKKRVQVDSDTADQLRGANLDSRRGGRQVSAAKVDAAGSESGQSGASGDQSYVEARTWTERYRAADRRLTYEIRAGKYILKSEMREKNFTASRIARDQLLNMSAQIGPLFAAQTDQSKITEILDTEIRAVIEDYIRALGAVA